jgi:hypothetical protein
VGRYDNLPGVVRYPRQVFLDQVWAYRPGEHVTFLGPTGNGKTYLAQQLLERSCSPELPALSLILKPRDSQVKKWAKASGHRVVTSYPPGATIWRPRKPPGYVLWPKYAFNPAVDKVNHHRVFRDALLYAYRKGNHIVFADETVGLQMLGLDEELEALWMQGRSMQDGLWAASQAPVNISTYAYGQAQHLFLGFINDKRKQARLGEISGIDESLVRYTVSTLRRYEWLYIRQEDRKLCIVEK